MIKNGQLVKWCAISLNGKYICSDYLTDSQIAKFKSQGYIIE
jgi:hypothetical protein